MNILKWRRWASAVLSFHLLRSQKGHIVRLLTQISGCYKLRFFRSEPVRIRPETLSKKKYKLMNGWFLDIHREHPGYLAKDITSDTVTRLATGKKIVGECADGTATDTVTARLSNE